MINSESESDEDYDLDYMDDPPTPSGILLCDDLLEMVGVVYIKLKRDQYLYPLITDINKLGTRFRKDKWSCCPNCSPYPFVERVFVWGGRGHQQLSTPELCNQYRRQSKHRRDELRESIEDGLPTTEWKLYPNGVEVEEPYVDDRDFSDM